MVNLLRDRSRTIPPLLFLLLIATGCRLGQQPAPTPFPLPVGMQAADSAPDLTTFPVTRGEVIQLETFSGRVTPGREEDLFFRRGGQVAEVYVADGDTVEAGDLIAALDNGLLEIDLESALLNLAIAKENLKDAEEQLARRRSQAENTLAIDRLRLQGASERVDSPDPTLVTVLEKIRQIEVRQSELELESIEVAVDPVLQLNVQRAELAVERVKQSILEGQITAPFSGEIRFINLPEADELLAVQGYNAVARLVDTSQVKIELNLTRVQLESLVEGMPVQISTASLAGSTLDGTISALPRPFGTSQGSLTEVTLTDTEKNALLREGVTVGVDVRLHSKPDALIIPRETLQEENQLYYATLKDGEQLRRVNIAVGVVSSDFVEVTAGLDEGQLVVASN